MASSESESVTDGHGTPEEGEEIDVEDMEEEEVDSLIDSMLDNDVDIEDLEEQEWQLGESKPEQLREFKGMKFLLKEPENDDELINAIEGTQGQDRTDQMRAWCEVVIEAPEITQDRWENQMTASERLALATMCAEFIGLADFIEL